MTRSVAELVPSGRVIAVGGHESDGGRALRGLLDPQVLAVTGGRELLRCVSESRGQGERVCVVPMTLGRDAELIADTARTLLALSSDERSGTVLAEPFGTAGHLVGWLRGAAAKAPARAALLVTAPSGDPFDDAELYRIARLTKQYGRHRTVEVSLIGGDPDPAEAVRRCRALGEEHVVLLPASWVTPKVPDPRHSELGAALLSPAAVMGVLNARVRQAWRTLDEQKADGLAPALAAAHGHGHGHGHNHSHAHGGHPHGHPHEAVHARHDASPPRESAPHFPPGHTHAASHHGVDTHPSLVSRSAP